MYELHAKILENNKKIAGYENDLAKNKKQTKLLEIIDKITVAITVISGFSILVISSWAAIPCALSLGGSYLIHQKQKKCETISNQLTVKRGMLLTENDKIKWEIKQKEKKLSLKNENKKEMTVGISKKPLVKSKNL